MIYCLLFVFLYLLIGFASIVVIDMAWGEDLDEVACFGLVFFWPIVDIGVMAYYLLCKTRKLYDK